MMSLSACFPFGTHVTRCPASSRNFASGSHESIASSTTITFGIAGRFIGAPIRQRKRQKPLTPIVCDRNAGVLSRRRPLHVVAGQAQRGFHVLEARLSLG